MKFQSIIKEMREEKKFYALMNILGDYGNPIEIITNSKEKMINALNDVYRLVTREEYVPYRLEDMDESSRIIKANAWNDKDVVCSHYISDDFTEVTDDKMQHISNKQRVEEYTNKKVKNFPIR